MRRARVLEPVRLPTVCGANIAGRIRELSSRMIRCGRASEGTHPLSVEPALLIEVAEIVLIGGRAEEPQVADLRARMIRVRCGFASQNEAKKKKKRLASKLVQK